MPSKYPVVKPEEVIKFLEFKDFRYVSQKGSHRKYTNAHKKRVFQNPLFMCVFIKVLIAEDSCEQSVYRFLYALRLYAGVVNYKRVFFSIFFIMKIFA